MWALEHLRLFSEHNAQGVQASVTMFALSSESRIVARMRNEVTMQCHFPPSWAFCFSQHWVYEAEINKHDVRLLFETQERPDYNKNGTIKKPGKVHEVWVKFSFV